MGMLGPPFNPTGVSSSAGGPTGQFSAPPWDITEIIGRFQNASNATFLAKTDLGQRVVYKPERGQRQLYDFDCQTLPAREILTFEVARAAGLDCVPETLPVEGPFGPGSGQLFIEEDEEFDPAPLINEADPRLWRIVTLDLIINNADRKAGHLIADQTGKIWCIDHGLTLHARPKLRTVMWSFSGKALPAPMVESLRSLQEGLRSHLYDRAAQLLSREEADALTERVEMIIERPVHPLPPHDRPPLPWPLW